MRHRHSGGGHDGTEALRNLLGARPGRVVVQVLPRLLRHGGDIVQLRQYLQERVARQFRYRGPRFRVARAGGRDRPLVRGDRRAQLAAHAQRIGELQASYGGQPVSGLRRCQALQPPLGGAQVAAGKLQAGQFELDRGPQRVARRYRLERGQELLLGDAALLQQRRRQPRAVPVRTTLPVGGKPPEQPARRLQVAVTKQGQRLPGSRQGRGTFRGPGNQLSLRLARAVRYRRQPERRCGIGGTPQPVQGGRLREVGGRQPRPGRGSRDLFQQRQRRGVLAVVEVAYRQRVPGAPPQFPVLSRLVEGGAEERRRAGELAAAGVHRPDAVLALGARPRRQLGGAPRQRLQRGDLFAVLQQRDAAALLLLGREPAPFGDLPEDAQQRLLVAGALQHVHQQRFRGGAVLAVREPLQKRLQRGGGIVHALFARQQHGAVEQRRLGVRTVGAERRLLEARDRLQRRAVLHLGERQVDVQHLAQLGLRGTAEPAVIGSGGRRPVAGGRRQVALQQRDGAGNGRGAGAGRGGILRAGRRGELGGHLLCRRQVFAVEQQPCETEQRALPVRGVGEQFQVAPVVGRGGLPVALEVLGLGNEEQHVGRQRRVGVVAQNAAETVARRRVAAVRQEQHAGPLQPPGRSAGIGVRGRGCQQRIVGGACFVAPPQLLQRTRLCLARRGHVGWRHFGRLIDVPLQRVHRFGRVAGGQPGGADPVPDLGCVGSIGKAALMGGESLGGEPIAVNGGGGAAARGAVEQAQRFQERSQDRLARSRRTAHHVAKIARGNVVQARLESRYALIVQVGRGDLRHGRTGRKAEKRGAQHTQRRGAARAPPGSHYCLLLPTSSAGLLSGRSAALPLLLLRLRRNSSLPSRM